MRRKAEARHFHERATVVARPVLVTLTVAGLLAASCGSDVADPAPLAPVPALALEPIPASALPGSPADPEVLDAPAVAADAIQPKELEALLDDAGFVGGTQRLFSRARPWRRGALARRLEFETAGGAERYLTWLRDHPEEVIGGAEPDPALDVPADVSVFVHEPDPCCHNDTRIFLATWTDGTSAITLKVGGPGAQANDVTRLVALLDAAV
jgi:hypothetical protein